MPRLNIQNRALARVCVHAAATKKNRTTLTLIFGLIDSSDFENPDFSSTVSHPTRITDNKKPFILSRNASICMNILFVIRGPRLPET